MLDIFNFWSLFPTSYSVTSVYICNLCCVLGIVILLNMRGRAQAMNTYYTVEHKGLPKPFLCGCRDSCSGVCSSRNGQVLEGGQQWEIATSVRATRKPGGGSAGGWAWMWRGSHLHRRCGGSGGRQFPRVPVLAFSGWIGGKDGSTAGGRGSCGPRGLVFPRNPKPSLELAPGFWPHVGNTDSVLWDICCFWISCSRGHLQCDLIVLRVETTILSSLDATSPLGTEGKPRHT